MDKLSIYEILSWIVPGSLMLGFVALLFPDGARVVSTLPAPDAFKVTFLLALALFVGQIAQAVASFIEPLLNRTWGGRPSETALACGLGDRYLPKDSAVRIRDVLRHAVGNDASDRSLFLFAMQRAESTPDSKAKMFNALYAYHRVLFTAVVLLLVCFTIAWCTDFLPTFSGKGAAVSIVVLVALIALLWHRARQRAFYYVREVLLSAERQLASPAPTK